MDATQAIEPNYFWLMMLLMLWGILFDDDRARSAPALLPRGVLLGISLEQSVSMRNFANSVFGGAKMPASEPTWSALVVDDDPGVRQSLRLCLELDGARVLGVGSVSAALDALNRSHFDVVFLDIWLNAESGLDALPEIVRSQPGLGVIVITAHASFESAVEAMRLGAVDYLPKLFTPEQVRHAAHRVVSASQLKRRITELQDRLQETTDEGFFETYTPTCRSFFDMATRAAASDAVILLRGESGTGKTVFARWLRLHSPRASGPFVTVHCPMLSGELMTSALFGHRKGSFTGAVSDVVGKVEEAKGGTLFLDEVADLTPDAQARLLRFLNDRTYERVGEAAERKADVRLIVATNRPLEEEVQIGRFREDLLFRLNVLPLTLLPLRERTDDILPLARHYLRFFEARQGRHRLEFSARAEAALKNHHWPGNLRELRNAVERAVILSPTSVLEPEDFGWQYQGKAVPGGGPDPIAQPQVGGDFSLEELEREHIAQLLAAGTSPSETARKLGIDPTTLQRKRKRYGLV